MSRKIGIDLGTANTLVYVPKRGIVAARFLGVNQRPFQVQLSVDSETDVDIGVAFHRFGDQHFC